MSERPVFAVDVMLGSLARWLRIMGYDASYQRGRDDDEIMECAQREGRIVLTRDRELAKRMKEQGIYIESDSLTEQLEQISKALDLDVEGSLTRCTVCNGELENVATDEIRAEVPPGVLENNHEFYRCKQCDKVYWKGSHWEDIERRIRELQTRID